MTKNRKALFTALLYILFFIFAGYLYVDQNDIKLKTKKYNALAVKMQAEIENLIKLKEKENVLISLALSLNDNAKIALVEKDASKLNFKQMITDISKYSDIDDIWIQLINARGESFYRTWTRKTGDSLLDVRSDVSEVLKTKKKNSFVSTGKYAITFKAMTPIFYKDEFVGIIESIVKFDSIVDALKTEGYDTVLFVDKRYKNQLKNTDEKLFIDDYFIATSNASKSMLNIVKETSVEKYIKIKNYHIDEKNGQFFTIKSISSISGKNMGYFILSYPLSSINFSSVTDERNKILFKMFIFFILIIVFLYYIYTVQYKRFIDKQNIILQDKVKEKTKSLQYRTLHDSLTHLPNRILLLKILQNYLRDIKQKNEYLYVLFLDLDRFKEVNDTFGHTVGDKLLKKVSSRLKKSLNEEDIVSRVSGDEFVVVVKDINRDEIIDLLDKIMLDFEEPFRIEKLELFINFSIGVSQFPADASSAKVLLRLADTAMYRAKEIGRNNYQFYDISMTEKALIRQELGRDLKKALINKEFEVYYQPKIDVLLGEIVGLESLIRWNHPIKGILYPSAFLQLAEEIGLIIQIDAYVREESFKQVVSWQKEGVNTGVLSLNISTKELESEAFLSRLNQTMIDLDFDIQCLEIEVVENQIMKDINRGIEILESIKRLGIKIAVDDFGTGYSSLSYLQKLPIDILKIDRSFIQDLLEDQSSIEIVRTIISLAKNLGLNVIAEGVETKEQCDYLMREGCNLMQGYYFSKPLSAKECKTFLLNR